MLLISLEIELGCNFFSLFTLNEFNKSGMLCFPSLIILSRMFSWCSDGLPTFFLLFIKTLNSKQYYWNVLYNICVITNIMSKSMITITIDEDVLLWVDDKRELVPRATFINSILKNRKELWKMNLILHDQFFLNQKKTVGVLWTPTEVETATNFPIGAFPNVR